MLKRTFLNWPMQAHGAEMMRIACILAVNAALNSAPLRDALLIEAPLNQITQGKELKECMAKQVRLSWATEKCAGLMRILFDIQVDTWTSMVRKCRIKSWAF